MAGIDTTLILPLVTIAAGALNSVVLGALKKASVSVDKLNAHAKQAILVVAGFGVAKLATLLNLPLPGDPTTWSGDVVNSVLIALMSLGVHNVKKTALAPASKEEVPPTPPTA
jgi:hypothetical protein